VRVVAGQARGRRLSAALPAHVRPTTDFVRESIFNLLATRVELDGADVVDLYCGSGALGIEALSRGAASCTFVDTDANCLAAARANLDAVGLSTRTATFVKGRLPAWRPRGGVDLALCDPPYTELDESALLEGLDARFVVIESDRALARVGGWEVSTERRYGGTLVTMLTSGRDDADS